MSQNLAHGESDAAGGPDAFRTYERIAPIYDAVDAIYEVSWKRRLRAMLFEGTSGRILDAGAGTGANVPLYPDDSSVVGIDISPRMLERARNKAAQLGKQAEFREMDIRDISYPEHYFDAIVSTFTLCVLPKEHVSGALREFGRIAKPDATIRILDYGPPSEGWAKAWLGLAQLWTRWAFAADYNSRTEDYVEAAGLDLVSVRPLMGGAVKLITLAPRRA